MEAFQLKRGRIVRLLGLAARLLGRNGVDSPGREAEGLYCAALSLPRHAIYSDRAEAPGRSDLQRFRAFLRRRAKREPFAYITGTREFYKHRFRVRPGVLIPRPETEELVEIALSETSGSLQVLDLCAGSGAIGISYLLERPDCRLVLADLSRDALTIAEENCAELAPTLKERIQIVGGDLYGALDARQTFDLIFCNPPYIHPDEAGSLEPEVLHHEPAEALFHADPPGLYRRIVEGATNHLKEDGLLLVELSPRWDSTVLALARDCFARAELRRDRGGQPRILIARRPLQRSETQRT